MRLADIGLTVDDVDLGGFDAESDHNLAAHFIKTPIVDRILSGRKYLVLGRKGSGKSALFKQLPDVVDPSVIVLNLTPDAYAWSSLQAYEEQGIRSDHAHETAWLLTIAVQIAERLTRDGMEWSNDQFRSAALLRRFVESNFAGGSKLVDVADGLRRGVDQFDVSAFGFGVGITRGASPPNRRPLTPQIISALLDEISVLLTTVRIVVQFDRIDDDWQGNDGDRSLIIGLLRATKEINDRFARAGLRSRVILYLRTDIYDSLNYDHMDKFRQVEERISWNTSSLENLISARLPGDLTVEDILEQAPMRGGARNIDYLIRRTFFRPREVLQYLQLALDEASGQDFIWNDDIQAVEQQFSQWKVTDLKLEYAKAVPELPRLIDALQQVSSPLSDLDALQAHLYEKVPDIVAAHDVHWCVRQLWTVSAIGSRLNNTGSVRFTSTDATFAVPAQGRIYIHYGLMKALNVKEARKKKESSGDPEDDTPNE